MQTHNLKQHIESDPVTTTSRALRRVKGSTSLAFNAQALRSLEPALATFSLTISPPRTGQNDDILESPILSQPSTQAPLSKQNSQMAIKRNSGDHPHRHMLLFDGVLQIPRQEPFLSQPITKAHSQPLVALRKKPKKLQPLQVNGRSLSRSSPIFFKFAKEARRRLRRLRNPVISNPINPFHLGGSSPRPLLRSEEFLPGEKTSDASQYVEAHHPEQTIANRRILAKHGENFPLRSHPVQVIVTSEDPNPELVSSISPSVVSRTLRTHSSRPNNLTVGHSWEGIASKEHKENCRLRIRLEAAETALRQTRERNEYLEADCADLLAKLNAARATSTQQHLFADAWQRAHGDKLVKIAALNDKIHQLQEREREAEIVCLQESFLTAPTTNRNTSTEELSEEELPILNTLAENMNSSNNPDELFLPSVPYHTPYDVKSGLGEESLPRAGPHELSATRSHQVLPKIIEKEEAQSPAEASIHDEEDIPYDPLELAHLRLSFNDVFSRSEDRYQENESENMLSLATKSENEIESPSLDTESIGTYNTQSLCTDAKDFHKDSSQAEETREVSSSPHAAIYRFGSRRIQPIPAVFRKGFESKSESDHEPSPETAVFLRLDSWEWSSIPELKLEYRL